MKLNAEQKDKIDEVLNKLLPANVTIGDAIKEALCLSDKEYSDLGDAIESYITRFAP